MAMSDSSLSKVMDFLKKVDELPKDADRYLDTYMIAYEAGYDAGVKAKAEATA